MASEKNKQGVANGDIHLAVGNCCKLVFENNSFDVVTTMNTIYFWENTIQGLQEIHRVLKEDGVFYKPCLQRKAWIKFFIPKNGFKKFIKEEYIDMGRQAGFKCISFKNLGYEYGLLVMYEK